MAETEDGTSDKPEWKVVLEESQRKNRRLHIYNVQRPNLQVVGRRLPFFDYLRALWNRRYFIYAESRAKAFGTIKGTILGKLWLVIEPFLNAGIYYLIFAVVLKFDRNIDNFVGYLVVGVTLFGFLQKQLSGAANIIPSGKNLIRAFYFPRASLVASFTLRNVIDFLPTIAATCLFIAVMPPHSLPYWTWLLFPFVFLLAIIFGLGISLVASALTALLSDLKFIWPLVARFWFYGSGVFWSIDRFADDSLIAKVMTANPGWVFLDMSRDLLVYHDFPSTGSWLYFSAWALVTLIAGIVLFWVCEDRIGKNDDR